MECLEFLRYIIAIIYLSGILILPKQEYNGQPDYWWLRSPYTSFIGSGNDVAFLVDPSGVGNVSNDDYGYGIHVDYSYGSPYVPSLNLGNPAVFEIDTNGDLATHINISHSYGVSLRTLITTAAMRTTCTRMAMSTTVGLSVIPTEYLNSSKSYFLLEE